LAPLRTIVWIFLLGSAVFALPSRHIAVLAQVIDGEIHRLDPQQWRRTVLGWEPTSQWSAERESVTPLPASTGVHPLIIAGMQVLVSCGALLTFAARRPKDQKKDP
jgi:hypothetical protein